MFSRHDFSFSYSNFTRARNNITVRCLKNKKTRCNASGFHWLGWKDLNPRNNGVRVRCLTTWRHPNISFCHLLFSDLFIISHFFVFVKSFFQISQKKFFLNFFQTVLRLTHDDLYSISHSAVFVKRFLKKSSNFVFFCIVALLQQN